MLTNNTTANRPARNKTSVADPDILQLLHRATQVADGAWAAAAPTSEVTARQFLLLSAVASVPGASQADLVEMTGMDRSTLADVVRRLVRKSYLQRRRTKADARAYAVNLTEEGRAQIKAHLAVSRVVDQRLGVNQSGIRKMKDILEGIIANGSA